MARRGRLGAHGSCEGRSPIRDSQSGYWIGCRLCGRPASPGQHNYSWKDSHCKLSCPNVSIAIHTCPQPWYPAPAKIRGTYTCSEPPKNSSLNPEELRIRRRACILNFRWRMRYRGKMLNTSTSKCKYCPARFTYSLDKLEHQRTTHQQDSLLEFVST